MQNSSIAQAHSILDFLLTKAAVSGKAFKSTLLIPYMDLKNSINEKDFEFEDVELKLTIVLKWVPRNPMSPDDIVGK